MQFALIANCYEWSSALKWPTRSEKYMAKAEKKSPKEIAKECVNTTKQQFSARVSIALVWCLHSCFVSLNINRKKHIYYQH